MSDSGQKLLTICIPTYNRAQQLHQQIAWLAEEIRGFEHLCEVIISDNCSTDDTQAVIAQWQPVFSQTSFSTNRNSTNIGWIRNFAYCLNAAVGRYTWLVGDDDVVYPGTLKYVINTLLQRPDLSLLYLNFSGHNVKTNQVQGDLWLDPEIAAGELSGKSIFQHSIEKDLGSVIFISAIVFQTQSAQTATQRWSQMLDNWACVATWAGFCATQGNVMITSESHLECIIGVSHWQKLPRIHFKTRYQDTPEVFLSLMEMGYPPEFCKRMILRILWEDLTSIRFIRSFVGSLLVKPLWALQVVKAFAIAIFRCLYQADPVTQYVGLL